MRVNSTALDLKPSATLDWTEPPGRQTWTVTSFVNLFICDERWRDTDEEARRIWTWGHGYADESDEDVTKHNDSIHEPIHSRLILKLYFIFNESISTLEIKEIH